jgi:sugar/nucleoside kinase (ribokinase family)
MRRIAVVGHLCLDVVGDGAPRIGGAPWYAARALRILGRPAAFLAKCGARERRRFLHSLGTLGFPATVVAGGETTGFTFTYEGDVRRMSLDAVGEPWRTEELAAVADMDWIHAAPLLRSDFDAEALATLGRGRRLLLDGQGLVRAPDPGPLRLDREFDPELLRHVTMLKLAEEEAELLEPLSELGVEEIVVTRGRRGARLIVGDRVEEIPAPAVTGDVDPTGAGDAFAIVYLAARAHGHSPVGAARRATALVAALLAGRTR